MARTPKETEFMGCKFKVTPLPYKLAEDHLADVGVIVTHLFERAAEDVDPAIVQALANVKDASDLKAEQLQAIVPVLGGLARAVFRQLGNGVLQRIGPAIFGSVIATATDAKGELSKFELVKDSDRGEFFDEHPETYFPLLFVAGSATYSRFFPVRDLVARSKKTTETAAA